MYDVKLDVFDERIRHDLFRVRLTSKMVAPRAIENVVTVSGLYDRRPFDLRPDEGPLDPVLTGQIDELVRDYRKALVAHVKSCGHLLTR